VVRFIERLLSDTLQQDLLLNINIPDLSYDKLNAWEVTRLGKRHKSEPAVKMQDPKGRDVYWVGSVGPGNDAGPGTDFYAVANNRISVTPLLVDLTRFSVLDDVANWISKLRIND
jgi:5'-nucleotidase